MAYENYSVQQFMNAWFKQDYSELTEEEFDIVKTEYVDTAGLFEEDEFDRVSYINFLSARINSIGLAIKLQKRFLDEFGTPYIEGFKFFKNKGHLLFWGNDKEKFLSALSKIEAKEKKYISKLEGCINDLVKYRKTKKKVERTAKEERESFVRTLISLGKIGYKIDKPVTTVEELAYMIKQQKEEYASSQTQ